MVLSVRHDETRPGGGYAVLEGDGLDTVTAISIESTYSGMYLGEDGTWEKVRALLPVAAMPGKVGSLSLGPQIVDAVATDMLLVLRGADGAEIGRVFWSGVIPTRGGLVHEQAPVVMPPPAPAPPPAPDPPPPPPPPSPWNSEPKTPPEPEPPPAPDPLPPPPPPTSRPPKPPPPAPVQFRRVATPTSGLKQRSWVWTLAAVGLVVVLASTHERHSDDVPGIVPRHGQEPSFTCQDDMSEPIDKLICADAELAEADSALGVTFDQLIDEARHGEKPVLQARRHKWNISRKQLCGMQASGSYDLRDLAGFKACVLRKIRQQRDDLLQHWPMPRGERHRPG